MTISKEIKLKVFAGYPGQSILISEPNAEPVSHYLEGIDFHLKTVIAERVNYDPWWIKLILRPLSEITDEEIMEFAKFAGLNPHVSKIPGFCEAMRAGENLKVEKILGNVPAYQYLQSKGYDLPHYLLEGKTLLECGLAIYKKEIQK